MLPLCDDVNECQDNRYNITLHIKNELLLFYDKYLKEKKKKSGILMKTI